MEDSAEYVLDEDLRHCVNVVPVQVVTCNVGFDHCQTMGYECQTLHHTETGSLNNWSIRCDF